MKRVVFACAVALALNACGADTWLGDKEDPPLPGDRISVMQLQQGLTPDSGAAAKPFVAPEPWRNDFWPQAGGYSNHTMQHLDLNPGQLKKIWSADIGAGSTKTNPLTAQPVLADGRIFTLDTDGDLSAFDAEQGKLIWRVRAGSADEDDNVLGGGLGFSGGMLFVTNGYAELLAVRPDDGSIEWRTKLPAPARAAPAVLDGRVYVVTLDNRLIAVEAASGHTLWDYQGINENVGLVGAASPAINHDLVVAPFSSGELFGLRVENGSVAWADNLAQAVKLGGVGGLSDIRALPVLDRGLVVAISYGGRMIAIDERSGQRVWQRNIGGLETPWVAGDTIFVLSDDAQIMALERTTGGVRWVKQLKRFIDPDNRVTPVVWTGPVYAGGRLLMANSEEHMVEVSPETGDVLNEWDLGFVPAVPMMVANGTLYVLGKDATLSAWR